MNARQIFGAGVAALILLALVVSERPGMIAAPDETPIVTLRAQGIQAYECKADPFDKLAWQFREPMATLFLDGKIVGRLHAGPDWELADGSAVTGKVVSRVSGATPTDIPWLQLDVVSRRGSGLIADAAAIRQLNTEGGLAVGPCESAGAFLKMPYSADYAFYRKMLASPLAQALIKEERRVGSRN